LSWRFFEHLGRGYRLESKLYGGLTAEALDKAAGALGDAFEPKMDQGLELLR